VIGVAEGGLLETVKDGQTGILIQANPRPAHVVDAVQAMTAERALSMRTACEKRAAGYDEAAFREKMLALIAACS
jgi:hypothetical protein